MALCRARSKLRAERATEHMSGPPGVASSPSHHGPTAHSKPSPRRDAVRDATRRKDDRRGLCPATGSRPGRLVPGRLLSSSLPTSNEMQMRRDMRVLQLLRLM